MKDCSLQHFLTKDVREQLTKATITMIWGFFLRFVFFFNAKLVLQDNTLLDSIYSG